MSTGKRVSLAGPVSLSESEEVAVLELPDVSDPMALRILIHEQIGSGKTLLIQAPSWLNPEMGEASLERALEKGLRDAEMVTEIGAAGYILDIGGSAVTGDRLQIVQNLHLFISRVKGVLGDATLYLRNTPTGEFGEVWDARQISKNFSGVMAYLDFANAEARGDLCLRVHSKKCPSDRLRRWRSVLDGTIGAIEVDPENTSIHPDLVEVSISAMEAKKRPVILTNPKKEISHG